MSQWNAQDVIDSLINRQFKQAKQQTFEGLEDTDLEDLEFAFNTLAYRICDVMQKLAIQGMPSLMTNYRKLFE